eukprot:scaffold7394_cov239-Ochromonas_danica.AAC.1
MIDLCHPGPHFLTSRSSLESSLSEKWAIVTSALEWFLLPLSTSLPCRVETYTAAAAAVDALEESWQRGGGGG